jgi:hypothetical protein
LVNADRSGFRLVKNAELKPEAFGAPAWARDSNSIFATTSTTFTTSISRERFEEMGAHGNSTGCEHE